MQYIEVATLRETILHQIRTGEAVDVIEQTLRKYSDAVWHNGRAHAHNEENAVTLEKSPESFIVHRPEQSNHRAELIQLTAAVLNNVKVKDIPLILDAEDLAEFAVDCADHALKAINQKMIAAFVDDAVEAAAKIINKK